LATGALSQIWPGRSYTKVDLNVSTGMYLEIGETLTIKIHEKFLRNEIDTLAPCPLQQHCTAWNTA
jgi:hypothetical protein